MSGRVASRACRARELPVLIVDDWSKVTPAFLEAKWTELAPRAAAFQPALHRRHWWRRIEDARAAVMVAKGGGDPNATRARCWGPR